MGGPCSAAWGSPAAPRGVTWPSGKLAHLDSCPPQRQGARCVDAHHGTPRATAPCRGTPHPPSRCSCPRCPVAPSQPAEPTGRGCRADDVSPCHPHAWQLVGTGQKPLLRHHEPSAHRKSAWPLCPGPRVLKGQPAWGDPQAHSGRGSQGLPKMPCAQQHAGCSSTPSTPDPVTSHPDGSRSAPAA